jgi:hypothetical protein
MRWEDPSPGRIVRGFVAVATAAFGIAAVASGEPKAWAACGAFGLMWAGWDFLVEYVFGPVGDWFSRLWTGEVGTGRDTDDLLPTLDDTIRLLENHLQPGVARSVVMQSAIRLEEIYRVVRQDPARARDVIGRARGLFPDAEELRHYQ